MTTEADLFYFAWFKLIAYLLRTINFDILFFSVKMRCVRWTFILILWYVSSSCWCCMICLSITRPHVGTTTIKVKEILCSEQKKHVVKLNYWGNIVFLLMSNRSAVGFFCFFLVSACVLVASRKKYELQGDDTAYSVSWPCKQKKRKKTYTTILIKLKSHFKSKCWRKKVFPLLKTFA